VSEAFIKKLAADVVQHPVFKEAMQTAVTDVLTKTLQSSHAGREFRLYVPKLGNVKREERAGLIRSQFNGENIKELAKQHGISVRQVRRIVEGGKK